MTERLNEVVAQTLVAALVVEALLRLWELHEADERLRLRLLVLLVPLALQPALAFAAPFRGTPEFRDGLALLSVRHFAALRVFGVGLDRLWLGACAVVGGALLLLDLVPWARRRLRPRGELAELVATPAPLAATVAKVSAELRVEPPRIAVRDSPGPHLACVGVRAPLLLVSTGTLALLDAEELEAAVAHELAHLERRDVLVGWALLAARVLQAFNPPVHVVARVIASDMEQRADALSATGPRRRVALASALVKTFRAGRSARTGRLTELLDEASEESIAARCHRLLAPSAAHDRWSGLRVVLTGAGLATLLFFVT